MINGFLSNYFYYYNNDLKQQMVLSGYNGNPAICLPISCWFCAGGGADLFYIWNAKMLNNEGNNQAKKERRCCS